MARSQFTITLRDEWHRRPGASSDQRLRGALKLFLRHYGLRCVGIVESKVAPRKRKSKLRLAEVVKRMSETPV